MKGQVNLYCIISGALLLVSSLCVAVVGLLQPTRTVLLAGLLTLQFFSIGLSFFITYRYLLLPLMHLKETTSAVLSSLDSKAPDEDSAALLQRFQTIVDREYNMRTAFRQAELDALQSQINPHFLYNTLECIRGQAIVEGNRPIADMARALSEFFRYSINRANPLVTVEDELRNVHAYMKIQNYRFGEKYEVRITMEEADRPLITQCLLPRLTIQPIIENSLIHGLHDSEREKEYLDIAFELTDTRLILCVTDHGVGMSQAQMDKLNLAMKDASYVPAAVAGSGNRHSGIALQNINERIRLLFGRDYGMRVYSTLGVGCTVEIVLPIKKAPGNTPGTVKDWKNCRRG